MKITTEPVLVNQGDEGSTLTVRSGSPVVYRLARAAAALGTLNVGDSVELPAPTWVASTTGSSEIDVVPAATASGGGGGGADATGLGAPATLANGATYFEVNAAGQAVALWVGVSGVPTKVMEVDLPAPGTIDPAALGEIFSRADGGATVTTTSRQILGGGPIVLAGGVPVSNLKVHTGSTAAGTPVHSFVAFYDFRTGALLAAGTDQTTMAIPANLPIDFPISYTPPTKQVVRPIIYVEATTVPNFTGKGSVQPASVEPRLGGLYDTLAADSGPGALPATLGTSTGGRGPFWCEWK